MGAVTLRIDADSAKAVNEFLKLEAAEKKVANAAKKIGIESKKADNKLSRMAKGGKKSMDGLTTGLGNAAKGFLSVAAAIAVVTKALDLASAARERASGEARGAAPGRGRLLALGATRQDRQRISKGLNEIRRTGLGTEESQRLAFTLESAGKLDQGAFFGRLKTLEIDPARAAEAAVTVQGAFGREEAGSLKQIQNKLLAGAKTSKFDAGQLALGVAKAGGAFKNVGATDEDLIAFLASAGEGEASIEEASTKAKALANALVKKGVEGAGFAGKIETLRGRGLSKQKLQKFLGSTEAVTGFNLFNQNQARFEDIRGQVLAQNQLTLQGRGFAGQALAGLDEDALIRQARLRRQAEARGQISRELIQERRQAQETAIVSETALARLQGQSEIAIALKEMQGNFALWLNTDPSEVRRITKYGLFNPQGKNIREEAERMLRSKGEN